MAWESMIPEANGFRVSFVEGGEEDDERGTASSGFGLAVVESDSSGQGAFAVFAIYSSINFDVFPPNGVSDLRR